MAPEEVEEGTDASEVVAAAVVVAGTVAKVGNEVVVEVKRAGFGVVVVENMGAGSVAEVNVGEITGSG